MTNEENQSVPVASFEQQIADAFKAQQPTASVQIAPHSIPPHSRPDTP